MGRYRFVSAMIVQRESLEAVVTTKKFMKIASHNLR
jgi:hypothetical protein